MIPSRTLSHQSAHLRGQGWRKVRKSMPETQKHFPKLGIRGWRGMDWAFVFHRSAEKSNEWLMWNKLLMDMEKRWVSWLHPASTDKGDVKQTVKSSPDVQPHHGAAAMWLSRLPCLPHHSIQPLGIELGAGAGSPSLQPPSSWINAMSCPFIFAGRELAAKKAMERWLALHECPARLLLKS